MMPPHLSDIPRIQSLEVLGVTISDSLSVAEHVNKVISSSVQSVHAFRLLRAHGMTHESLQIVYAASAWWGYASAADRQRQANWCLLKQRTDSSRFDRADDDLFEKVLTTQQPTSCSS